MALAAGPAYGTAIRSQILADTLGLYVPDSSLYTSLKRLKQNGLITGFDGGTGRTRLYSLSRLGWLELERWERSERHLLAVARRRLSGRTEHLETAGA